jgi:hypothetical protein
MISMSWDGLGSDFLTAAEIPLNPPFAKGEAVCFELPAAEVFATLKQNIDLLGGTSPFEKGGLRGIFRRSNWSGIN